MMEQELFFFLTRHVLEELYIQKLATTTFFWNKNVKFVALDVRL